MHFLTQGRLGSRAGFLGFCQVFLTGTEAKLMAREGCVAIKVQINVFNNTPQDLSPIGRHGVKVERHFKNGLFTKKVITHK